MAVIVLSAVAILSGAGLSGVMEAAEGLIITVGVVMTVAVAIGAVIIWRLRHHYRPDYIRSMHGPGDRDEILDQRAALRREIALTRAARRELEIEVRKNGIAAWREDVNPVVWAEVVGEEEITGR